MPAAKPKPSYTPQRRAAIETAWAADPSPTRVRKKFGMTRGQMAGRIMSWNLHRKASGEAIVLKQTHPAIVNSRSRWDKKVLPVRPGFPVLRLGRESTKLGHRVLKGPWAGMPIFSLTLEERATCPTSCDRWHDCFGNAMHLAVRYQHGPELIGRLERELSYLQKRHRRGFVVRLHVLGDFYSVQYVAAWRRWLHLFPALHVFGYTHRERGTAIGDALAAMPWERFAIRFSGGERAGRQRAITIASSAEIAHRSSIVVCPAQTHAKVHCASCGLCWLPQARAKTIAFIKHGAQGRKSADGTKAA